MTQIGDALPFSIPNSQWVPIDPGAISAAMDSAINDAGAP